MTAIVRVSQGRAASLAAETLRNTSLQLSRTPVASAVALALLSIGASGIARAQALPTGHSLTGGNATVTQTNPNALTINQTTQRAALDWQTFSIGSGNTVKFVQPDAASVILNRVVGGSRSEIFGSLQANGQVFLLNPAGVYMSRTASVDVGGLVASTLDMAVPDFMKGRYAFTGGSGSGSVENHATITVPKGGYVAFLGKQVHNTGTITASRGSVGFGAGDSMLLDFDGDGLLQLKVNAAAADASVTHGGVIHADGGRVVMSAQAKNALLKTVLNVDGMITARGMVEKNGEIFLDGGKSGVTSVTKTLDASSSFGKGGEIRVLGENVGLFGNALLDATGTTGGGTVLLGGDYQGRNPDIANALAAFVGKNARIKADATTVGDGGKVIVWADGTAKFYGNISARGGAEGGNGGSIEVSGKQELAFAGFVDATAPRGLAGSLLLDPDNINIVAAGSVLDNVEVVDGTVAFTDRAGETLSISGTAIDAVAADLTLQAQNNITVSAGGAINKAAGALAMQAGNSITIGDTVTVAGALTLSARDPGAAAQNAAGTVTVNAAISGNGITITNNVGATAVTLAANANAGAGNLSLSSGAGGINQTAGTITANTVTANSTGSVALNSATNAFTNLGASSGNGFSVFDTNTLTVTGAVSGGTGAVSITTNGNLIVNAASTIDGATGVGLSAAGNVTLNATAGATTTGPIQITADSDANGTGTISTTAAIGNAGAGAITLKGFDIALGAGVTGGSTVALTPSTVAETIGIEDATKDFKISNAELALITAPGVVTIGSALNTGGITVGTNNAVAAGALNLELATAGALAVDATNGITTTGTLTFSADDMALNNGVITGSSVTLRPTTLNRAIDLGTNTAGTLGLTAGEINTVVATGGTLTIGRNDASAAGAISISAPIDTGGNASTLVLRTGSSITQAAGGNIVETNLGLVAGTGVDMTNLGNNVTTLAGLVTGAGNFAYTETAGSSFTVVNLAAVNPTATTGIQTTNGAIALTATGGGTVNLGANLITAGGAGVASAVTLTGPVVLTADAVTVNTSAGGGNVTFTSTIDADDAAANNRTLTILAGAGAVTFGGAIGATHALADLDVTGGAISLGNATVNVNDDNSTAATVTFTGPVVIGANVTVNADKATGADNSVTFGSTINADDAAANDRTLTLNAGTGGTLAVTGAVGNTQALAALTITNSNGATFSGPVTVNDGAGAITLTNTTAGQTIAFADNLTATSLATTANGYNVSLTGSAVSITSDTNFLNTGTVTLGDASTDVLLFSGGLATATNGTNPSLTNIGGIVRTAGLQIDLGAVTLIGNATIDSTNNGGIAGGASILFQGTINADNNTTADRTLTVNAGTANQAIFNGVIGGAANGALADLDVTAALIRLNGATINVNDNDAVQQTVTFNGPIRQGGGTTTITTDKTSGVDNHVTFVSNIDSNNDTVNDSTVTVLAGGATVTLGGNVGAGANGAMAGLNVTAGTINVNGATVNLNDDNAPAATSTFTGAVVLGNNVTITTDKAAGSDNSLTFTSTINADDAAANNRTLTLNTGEAGTLAVGGAIGNLQALAALTITNSNGATFSGPVTVNDGAGAITLTNTTAGQTISFADNVTATSLATTANGYNVSLTGSAVSITNDTSFLNTGTVTLGNASGDVLLFAGGLTTATNATNPSLTNIGGTVRTAGQRIEIGAATLIDNAIVDSTNNGGSAAGANVRFNGTINADNNTTADRTLTVNAGTAGEAIFNGVIGGAANGALADLDVTAALIRLNSATINVNDNDAVQQTVTFNGPIRQGGGTTTITTDKSSGVDNHVTFVSTIDSNNDTVNDSTVTVLAGNATVTLGGNVGAGANGAMAGLNVTAGTINVNGATINLNDDNAPAATSAFTGAVVLGNNVTITTDKAAGADSNFTFGSTVNADAAGNNRTLGIQAGSGSVALGANIGTTQALADLDVTGSSILFNAATAQTVTVNAQGANVVTFNGPVTLAQNLTITTTGATPNNVTFASTIDADGVGNRTLNVNAGGQIARFSGNIGATNPLADFDVTADLIRFNAGAAQTVNASAGGGATVTFNGPVSLDQNVTIITAAGNNNISFTNRVDADIAASNRTLTLDAGTGGTIAVAGAIGSAQPLAGLTITNSNGATFSGAVTVNQAAGAITITDTTDNQTVAFAGNVTANSLVTTNNAYNVSLTGSTVTINNDVNLLNTGSVTLGDAPADVLLFNGGLATAGNASNPALTRAGGTVRTSARQIDLGPVTLIGNATVDSANNGLSPAGTNVNFASTINADDSTAADRTLTVNAGTGGAVTFSGNVGAGANGALANLTVTGATINLNAATFNVNDDNAAAATSVLTGAVVLGANVTYTTDKASGIDNSVTLARTVNADAVANNRTFNVASGTGTATFSGSIGDTQALRDFDGTAGSVVFNAAAAQSVNVNASGGDNAITALISGPVTLSQDLTVSAGASNVRFGGTINGARALALNSSADVQFDGRIGQTTALTAITTDATGRTVFNVVPDTNTFPFTASARTSGNQTYNDLLFLQQHTFLHSTAGIIALNGGFNTNGSALFTREGAGGGSGGGCDGAAGSFSGGGTFSNCLVLLGNFAMNSSATNADIVFNSTVNAATSVTDPTLTLTAGTGNIAFAGTVGGTRRVGDVSIVSANNVAGNIAGTADAASITAKSLTQTAGTATTRLSNLTTTGAADADGGSIAITTTGAVSISGSITAIGGTASAGNPGRAGGSVTINGGDVNVAGILTVGSAGNTGAGGAGGAITLNATDGTPTITLNANLATFGGSAGGAGNNAGGAGGAVAFQDPVVLANGVSIQTQGGAATGTGTSGTGGNVTFSNTLNPTAAFQQNLNITAGSGNVIFGGAVGGGVGALGDVIIFSANNVAGDAGATVDAAALTLKSLTEVAGSGTTRLSTVTTTGAANDVGGGVVITTSGPVLASGAIVANGGTPTAGNSGRAAGTVQLSGSDVSVAAITANGSDAAAGAGGAGGAVILNATDLTPTITLSGSISTRGGNAAGAGNNNAGAGGAVTFQAPLILVNDTIVDARAGIATGTGTMTGGNVAFNGSINSATAAAPRSLTVNTQGTTTFGDNSGDDRLGSGAGVGALLSLTTDAGGTTVFNVAAASTPTVNTTTTQTYNDDVVLAQNTVLTSTGTGTNGNITFNGALNSQTAGSERSLTVNSQGALTFGDNAGDDRVGGNVVLSSLTTDTGGTTVFNVAPAANFYFGGSSTATVRTTGNQTYDDLVIAQQNTFLVSDAGAVRLNADALTLGTILIIREPGGGGCDGFGGSFSFAGAGAFDCLSLFADTTLTSTTNGPISFSGRIDSGRTLTLPTVLPRALTVNTTSTTTFGDNFGDDRVGGINPLLSVTTNAGGTTVFNVAAASGTTVTTTAAQTYSDNVRLAQNTTLTSTAGGDILFNGSVNSQAAGSERSLAVNTQGTTRFGNNIGDDRVGGSVALLSLATDAGGVTVLNVAPASGAAVTTTTTQTYGDNVTLVQDTTLVSTGTGANGDITFNGAVNSQAAGSERLLIVNTQGTTTFGNNAGNDRVGGNVGLLSLTTDAGGTTVFNVDPANTPTVTTTTTQTYNDDVVLAQNTVLTSTGTGANGNVTFNGSINSQTAAAPRSLVVNTAGTTTFGDNTGDDRLGSGTGLGALLSLTTDAGGTTVFNVDPANTPTVTTTTTQTYNDDVVLAQNTVLTSTGAGANGNVTFNGSINSQTAAAPRSLVVNTAGTTTFGDNTGDDRLGSGTGLGALLSLTTDAGGTTVFNVAPASGTPTVNTTTTQTYNDDAVLAQNTVLTSTGAGANGNVTFNGSINSQTAAAPRSLVVNTAGTTTFGDNTGDDRLGSGTGLGALLSLTTDAGGTTVFNVAPASIPTVTTTTTQTYNDDVVLAQNTVLTSTGAGANGNVTFNGSINSQTAAAPRSLVVNTAGTTTFGDNTGDDRLGSGTGLGALLSLTTDAGGTTVFNVAPASGTPTVNTTTTQTYNDDVVLAQNTVLTSTGAGANGNVTFNGSINSQTAAAPRSLVVNTAGTTTFGDNTGDDRLGSGTGLGALLSLTTDAGGTTVFNVDPANTPTVTTTTTQTYNDDAVLAQNTVLTSTGAGANGNVTFNGSINSQTAAAPRSLVVNTAGTTTFGDNTGDDRLGSGTGLGALLSLTTDAGGTTVFNVAPASGTPTVNTTTTQTYNDDAVLAQNTVLTSTGAGANGNVTFNGSINSHTAAAPRSLVVNTAGTTTFGDNTGDDRLGSGTGLGALLSLATDAGGTTVFNVAPANVPTVNTTTTQTYNDDVVLAQNTVLTSTGTGANGNVTFNGSINSQTAAAPRSLVVNTAGTTTFGDNTGDDRLGSGTGLGALLSLATDAGGTTVFNVAPASIPTVTTTTTQTYNDDVVLAQNTVLTSTGAGANGNVTFNGSINSQTAAAPRSLVVNTAGTTTFGDNTGDDRLGSGTGLGALLSLTTDAGGTTVFNVAPASGTPTVNTTTTQAYGDNVTLAQNTVLTSTGSGANGDIGFNGTVNSQTTGSERTLLVNTAGTTTFSGAVGSGVALASLSTDAAGTAAVNGGAVTTTGAQTFRDDVTLGAAATLLTSTGNDTVTFEKTVKGGSNLTVTTSGLTSFVGAVGDFAGGALASVTANGGGTVAINGGGVTTSGAQTYNDAVTLGADAVLTSTGSGAIAFASTVRSPTIARSLTVNTSGTTTFTGAVGDGAGNALLSLATGGGGTTAIDGGSVTTTGAQTYGDAVTLGTNTLFASTGGGAVSFNNTLNGAVNVTVNTAGATTFGGAVGGSSALSSLATDTGGTTAINGGTITTSGSQTYGDAVTIGANATLASSGGSVSFANDINADAAANNRTLTINAPGGSVTFSGSIGNTAALADLDVTASAATIFFNGAAAQTVNVNAGGGNTVTFNAPVVLSQNVTVNTDGAVDNNVAFTNRINADTAATPRTLTVTTGTGTATFGSGIGSGVADRELGAVTLAGANVNLTGDVLVTGGGNVDLTGVTNLSFTDGAKIDTDRSGGTSAAGSVLMSATTKVTAPATQTAAVTYTIDASADGGAASGNVQLGSLGTATAPIQVLNVFGESVNVLNKVQGQKIAITANTVATNAEGILIASQAFNNNAATTNAAVRLQGLTTAGIFGTSANPIRIQAPGLFVVLPNTSNTLPVVFLGGDPSLKPVYEFADDPTKRVVLYNGVAPDSPAARAALGAALAPIREVISEVLLAGFAKENIRRQLLQGQVLETGLSRPGIDEFTGDGVTQPNSCQGSTTAAQAGAIACQ